MYGWLEILVEKILRVAVARALLITNQMVQEADAIKPIPINAWNNRPPAIFP